MRTILAAILAVTALAGAPIAHAMVEDPAPPPSAEAEALGKKIAAGGTLAVLLPLMVAKDVGELVASHPELDAAGKERLRATATALAQTKIDELMTSIGHQYAVRLSLADLKVLAAYVSSDAAKRRSAIEPMVIANSMQAMDGFDLKAAAWTAFCKDPAAKCAPAK